MANVGEVNRADATNKMAAPAISADKRTLLLARCVTEDLAITMAVALVFCMSVLPSARDRYTCYTKHIGSIKETKLSNCE